MQSEVHSSKNLFFVGMMAINIILAICVAGTFLRYISVSRNELYNQEIISKLDFSTNLSEQMTLSVMSQSRIAEQFANYIEKENLSVTRAIAYLKYWSEFYYEIDLIKAEDYSCIDVISDPVTGEVRACKTSKKDNPYITEICDNYAEVAQKGTMITDVFNADTIGSKVYGIYVPTKVQYENYFLFFIIPVNQLENLIGDYMGIDKTKGILIDGEGNVIFGNFKGYTDINFFDELRKNRGEETVNKVKKEFESGENGWYEYDTPAGEKFACVYSHLKLGRDWIYLYHHPVKTDTILSYNYKISLRLFAVMVCWLFIDIAGYWIYNSKLRVLLDQMEEANENLVAAGKSKDIFISNMSHEIRTPINAVLGMDEMIIRETDDANIKSYAYDIKNAGKLLLGLINDILDYSKIESGKMEIIEDEYDLGSVVNDLYNIISGKAQDKGLELKLNVNTSTPHLLYGDELRIKQIILNILTNSIKYTEKGTVTFSIDFEKADNNNIYLLVSVQDTGIGIKEEEMDKLTRAFERLDEKRNRSIEGTGLGMSIITRLLEQMGSKLEVQSVYGKGSEFSFKLYQQVRDSEPVGDVNATKLREAINKTTEEEEPILRASKAKVLVVDDTPVNLTVVKGLLKRTGVQLDMADSGEDCLQQCANKKYDIILLDHRMPIMDGIETLKNLRKPDTPNKETPVIALTANVVSGAYEMYMKEGFTDFLSKPVSGSKLEKMLLKYLPQECLDSEEDIVGKIDRAEGIKACGTEDIYKNVLGQFVDSYQKTRDELEEIFANKDIKNYTIKVHALKSSAKLVGAIKLSEEALALEQSGHEENWTNIENGHKELMEHFAIVTKNVQKMTGKVDEKPEKQPLSDKEKALAKMREAQKNKAIKIDNIQNSFSEEETRNAINTIAELARTYDFESIKLILQLVEQNRLDTKQKDKFKRLQKAANDYDAEKIQEILRETV